MTKHIDPMECRAAVSAVAGWLDDPEAPRPPRAALAAAVRQSARMLAQEAPGHAVELRVPPFVAVQCIDGPRHTRGTPPNVVECDPRTWLLLATGRLAFADAAAGGAAPGGSFDASGTRAGEIAGHLPVVAA
ncbi:sterol carrier family protein [Corynebacterium sp. 335C]